METVNIPVVVESCGGYFFVTCLRLALDYADLEREFHIIYLQNIYISLN